ncbi:MAG: hypothetical protein L0I76_08490 [Pseudonocardia sp.]|nr:hypothetical protein [Pseudonocardia sp.]
MFARPRPLEGSAVVVVPAVGLLAVAALASATWPLVERVFEVATAVLGVLVAMGLLAMAVMVTRARVTAARPSAGRGSRVSSPRAGSEDFVQAHEIEREAA